jgi:uncharacterized protein (TIGR02145 family)
MIKVIYLFIYLSICMAVSLNGQVINSQELEEKTDIKRNAMYNLEEIKVRWKKAALDNCTGVPCIVTPTPPSFTCGTSTISDFENNAYNTVLIGTQCWTTENLKATTYNDGTAIPLDASGTMTGSAVGQTWSTQTTGAYTIHGNESSTGAIATNYGFLYNYYAAKGISTVGSTTYKNLCPIGWHVPIDLELTALETELGGSSVAGGKMKSTSSLWNASNPGDNTSGFAALPGTFRDTDGSFGNLSYDAFFWSATENSASLAWYRQLNTGHPRVDRYNINKSLGASVRCLKNSGTSATSSL